MTKLVLSALTKAVYQDNVACAYVYYNSKSKPQDQHGNPVHAFYQEPFQLQKYLTNTVLPIINHGLKNSAYKAVDVDFENQAPHPFISIMRRDHAVITTQDLSTLNNLITKIIKPVSLVNPTSLFHKEKIAKSESDHIHQHHKNIHQSRNNR